MLYSTKPIPGIGYVGQNYWTKPIPSIGSVKSDKTFFLHRLCWTKRTPGTGYAAHNLI